MRTSMTLLRRGGRRLWIVAGSWLAVAGCDDKALPSPELTPTASSSAASVAQPKTYELSLIHI